jgi:tetratricopeptide (TPR) repeat protein
MDKATAYQILAISKESSDEEIKAAYIRLVKLHPPEQDPDGFIQVRKAYENLKEPSKRAHEDLFTFNFIHDSFRLPSGLIPDLNEINRSMDDIDMQLQTYPDDPMLQDQYMEIIRQRAAHYVSKKLWSEAINDWLKIMQRDPGDANSIHNLFYAYNTMAYHYAVNDHFTEAIHYWLEALKFEPDNPAILHNLAIAYDRNGNRDESEKYWKDTLRGWDLKLKQNGSDEYLRTCIVELHKFFGGRLLPSKGETTVDPKEPKSTENAVQEYREVLKYDPSNYHAQMQIATAFMQENKWADATRELAGMLKIHRDNPEILNLLGWTYLNTGKVDEAFAIWNRALSLDPKNVTAKDNIVKGHLAVGKKLRDRGLYNAALVHFKSLLKYLPDKPEVHFEIGTTYAMKGDHRSAVTCWQTVLQLDPKNKLARKAIAETRFR